MDPTLRRLSLFERYLTLLMLKAHFSGIFGVRVEVPAMLCVCSMCNRTRHWFPREQTS